MKKPSFQILLIIFIMLSGLSCKQKHGVVSSDISIIPKPMSIEQYEGSFTLNDSIVILAEPGNDEISQIAGMAQLIIQTSTGLNPEIRNMISIPATNAIVFKLNHPSVITLGKEGYTLVVDENHIEVNADEPAGIFYGMQSLLQLLPCQIYSKEQVTQANIWTVPCVKITDKPRYEWRGMHLDVSRHFFPKEFIKEYIDLIAMHKMNVFHWHLTDDNGWRIEIKKYPKLTDISAWRVDREDKPWNERELQKEGEQATYGGFYTQDDIKEIVDYAKKRYVTVVPEIEMPGHTSEVFAAYPELSCRGKKLTVIPGTYWPNIDIFCAGNDQVFTFLEDVLTEVMGLFSSRYIHIGGDEADKTLWKVCPKCQKRIREEGLKDENELQSYFIKRIEAFINANGKKMIGWDEILEGGLAPEATVMSWRGFEGGIKAAKMQHDVVMCPGSHCYFDHYQGDPETQPKAIGGYTSLKKVYSFEPTPSELSGEEAAHVLGAQGNLWTEYIATPEHAEYMAVPRMTALAEVLWSDKTSRNWNDFNERLQRQFKRFNILKVNYCKGSFKIGMKTCFDTLKSSMHVIFESEIHEPVIRYTINGKEPDLKSKIYSEPVKLIANTTVKAGIFQNDTLVGGISEKTIVLHEGIGKKVIYTNPYSQKYPGVGDGTLFDGIRSSDYFNDGCWLGFEGNDLEVTIDLKKVLPLYKISSGFLQKNGSWIFLPVSVEYLSSMNGNQFNSLATVMNNISPAEEKTIIKDFTAEFKPVKARYVKILARNMGVCPKWHPGAGEKAWMFADEIIID